jgi:DNA-binding transcriptional regulator YdaS (Cro superfamily)
MTTIQATNPNRLLDEMIANLRVANDAALARALGIGPPTVSKLRHLRAQVTADILLCMHDASGLSISELRSLMGAPEPAPAPAPVATGSRKARAKEKIKQGRSVGGKRRNQQHF